jgi:hypothetical protein
LKTSASPAISISCLIDKPPTPVPGITGNYPYLIDPLKNEPTVFAWAAKILNYAADAQMYPPAEKLLMSDP